MIEVVAAIHEAEDNEFSQHPVSIHLFPCLYEGFAEGPGFLVKMPGSFCEKYGSTEGAIDQRLVQCGHQDWMSGVEMGGEGRQVEKHNNLCEGKGEEHSRHEG